LRTTRHRGNTAAVGDDLVLNFIAEKVKVVGQLKESGEFTIITVVSFDVAEE